jgi:AcrR family transcriptional regulator
LATVSRRFGVPKNIRPARQARSRATLDRILDATLPLLDGRDFENVPVTEITDAAGISASSLYARFPTKASLLQALHERHLEHARGMVDAVVTTERDRPGDPADVLRGLIQMFLLFQADHQGPAQTFRRAEAHDAGFARRRQELDRFAIRLVRDYLLELYDPAERAEHGRRIELALWVLCTGMIAAVHPPHRFADLIGMDPAGMVPEIYAMFAAYLDLDAKLGRAKEP